MEFKNELLREGICPLCGSRSLDISTEISQIGKKKEKTVKCEGCKMMIFAELRGN